MKYLMASTESGNCVKSRLLLYLASASDPHRYGLGAALAMAAERAGWLFDAYYDGRRSGRHYGGFDFGGSTDALAGGTFITGGRHLDQTLWLSTAHAIAAVGDQFPGATGSSGGDAS